MQLKASPRLSRINQYRQRKAIPPWSVSTLESWASFCFQGWDPTAWVGSAFRVSYKLTECTTVTKLSPSVDRRILLRLCIYMQRNMHSRLLVSSSSLCFLNLRANSMGDERVQCAGIASRCCVIARCQQAFGETHGPFPVLDLSENVSVPDDAVLLLVLRDSCHFCRVCPYHSALVGARGGVACLSVLPLVNLFLPLVFNRGSLLIVLQD